MAKTKIGVSLLLSLLFTEAALAVGRQRTYIVQMQSSSASTTTNRLAKRQSSLAAVNVDPLSAVLYDYHTVLDGFAASLTPGQAAALLEQPDVLSVSRDSIKYLHTTHSQQFLGVDSASLLQQRGANAGMMNPMNYVEARDISAEEGNIIIGMLDSGIWPESASFSDEGMGPVPARWKGICEVGDQWTAANCNKKLIGARAFYKGLEANFADANETFDWSYEYKSARDADGHGTHTSSTVAGAAVETSLYGLASGTAKGVVPGARIAMYKCCFGEAGCAASDMLASMDTAVSDGVNIISMSIGGLPELGGAGDSPEAVDAISTGAYGAAEHGVLVSASGGNAGPEPGSVVNNAPWVLTVGASTTDRYFPATVVLGNGATIDGESLSVNASFVGLEPPVDISATQDFKEIVLAADFPAPDSNSSDSALCIEDSLDATKVAGKIVVCLRGENNRVSKAETVHLAGGIGMLLVNDETSGESYTVDAHIIPTIALGHSALEPLLAYAGTKGSNASSGATARLDVKGTAFGRAAPQMASFSSRGPSYPAADILKPDITGPGVDILAAWNGLRPTALESDTRNVDYNTESGTSMSCPHLSGVAAYIMARRPEWTAAQVKSAMMTTAYTTYKDSAEPMTDSVDNTPATVFAYGNGHVDPLAALDPGLVYDIKPTDYLDFLCAINYTTLQVRVISRNDYTCDPLAQTTAYDINYPSFAIWYNTNTTTGDKTVTFNRQVTNVGEASTYTVDVAVEDSSRVKVSVDPETLTFGATGETQNYSVTVTLSGISSDNATSGARLVWKDGTHTVASSMGFFWGAPDINVVGFQNFTSPPNETNTLSTPQLRQRASHKRNPWKIPNLGKLTGGFSK